VKKATFEKNYNVAVRYVNYTRGKLYAKKYKHILKTLRKRWVDEKL